MGSSGGLGGLPAASEAPSASGLGDLSPEQLKQQLEAAGVTVTYVGTEARNGVDSDHMSITIDPTKLAGSGIAKGLPGGQLGQIQQLAGEGTASGDLWFDRAAGRISEADINLADKKGETAKVTILA